MKMNKKVIGLVLAGMLSVGMVGCGNNEPNLQGREVPSKMEEMPVVEEESVYDFDEHNILSFGTISVDNVPDYEGDEFVDFKCKVTNNSDKMINTVTVDFAFYDEEGTLLSTTHPQDGNSIPSGNSFYIDGLYNTTEYNVKGIKIVGYSYYIGEIYYTVDLMGQIVEVWE
jgi:hypothetical protein